MGASIATERRLLSETEYSRVVRSHYPELPQVPRDELIDLARWLRSQRDRASGIIRDRRRARRGKSDARGAGTDPGGERGLAAKKQVFARALKRVNGRLDHLRAEAKRAEAAARLRDAVARRRSRTVHHPQAGPTARSGMNPIESAKAEALVRPAEIGRVSQAVRDAQAAKDGRGG